MKTLSIVIPCYNEKDTLRELLRRVFALSIPGWQIEVVIVDDCSADGTREILREYESRARVIYRQENGGKGSAVRDGLAAATGDYVIIQDADLEYHPRDIVTMVQALGREPTVVFGSRNITSHTRKGFIISRLGVWFITQLVNILYGAELTDIWTCYKLFPASMKTWFGPGRFDAEVIFTLQILRAGHEIREVPISHAPRDAAHGKKIQYRDGFQVIFLILKDWCSRLGRVHKRLGFLFALAGAAVLAIPSMPLAGHHHIDPLSDAPSYIQAMDVLSGAPAPASFAANRVITTAGGLYTVIGLSAIFGGYEPGWIIMNVFFYIILTLIFYGLIRRIHGSAGVAFLSAMFLAGNYAMLDFGLSYFMDVGGWAFYIACAVGVASYAETGRIKHLCLAALAAGVGGLFKEYALLGALLIGFYLIYENFRSIGSFFRKVWRPALIVAIPTLILHISVYLGFHYTYLDWLHSANEAYVYHSRALEFIKVFGSLFNVLAILSVFGLYYFLRGARGAEASAPGQSKNIKAFTACFLLSAVPILFWPAITQRIAFVFVPAAILFASYLFKRYERRWYLFLPVLAVYLLMSFYMDSHILNFVNLPF